MPIVMAYSLVISHISAMVQELHLLVIAQVTLDVLEAIWPTIQMVKSFEVYPVAHEFAMHL